MGSRPLATRVGFAASTHGRQTGSFVPVPVTDAGSDGTRFGLQVNACLQLKQCAISVMYPMDQITPAMMSTLCTVGVSHSSHSQSVASGSRRSP